MRPEYVSIDINRLNEEELNVVAEILYNNHRDNIRDNKAAQTRIAFLNGWLSPEAEARYHESLREA